MTRRVAGVDEVRDAPGTLNLSHRMRDAVPFCLIRPSRKENHQGIASLPNVLEASGAYIVLGIGKRGSRSNTRFRPGRSCRERACRKAQVHEARVRLTSSKEKPVFQCSRILSVATPIPPARVAESSLVVVEVETSPVRSAIVQAAMLSTTSSAEIVGGPSRWEAANLCDT